LIAAQFVKPFVKSNKNDFVDAEAIAPCLHHPHCHLGLTSLIFRVFGKSPKTHISILKHSAEISTIQAGVLVDPIQPLIAFQVQRGSSEIGVRPGSYASVIATHPKDNTLTVRKDSGEELTYNPSRLRGVDAYAAVERNFSVGDRIRAI
jgi:hypothetical protein